MTELKTKRLIPFPWIWWSLIKKLALPLGHSLRFSRILRELEILEQERPPLVPKISGPTWLSNSSPQPPHLHIWECDCLLCHCPLFCHVQHPLLTGMNCWVGIKHNLYGSPQYSLMGYLQRGIFCILYLAVSQMYASFDSHRTSTSRELFCTFQ